MWRSLIIVCVCLRPVTLPLVKNSTVLPRGKTHHSYRSSSEQTPSSLLALNSLSVYQQCVWFICVDLQISSMFKRVHCHDVLWNNNFHSKVDDFVTADIVSWRHNTALMSFGDMWKLYSHVYSCMKMFRDIFMWKMYCALNVFTTW